MRRYARKQPSNNGKWTRNGFASTCSLLLLYHDLHFDLLDMLHGR